MPQSSSTPALRQHLRNGQVIPAHPLALTADLKLDERRQRALTRYYCAAGAGGVAVGVHTTQFELHQPQYGLLEPVLELASETVDQHLRQSGRPFAKVAGIVGETRQALREAELALAHGYDAGLLSLRALAQTPAPQLLQHCRRVAEIIPIIGFYLQPAVGGQVLPYRFWHEFAEIENVVAIKIAPFDRYKTLDVVRAVAESCRSEEIALYTGNDDNIVADLLTPVRLRRAGPRHVKHRHAAAAYHRRASRPVGRLDPRSGRHVASDPQPGRSRHARLSTLARLRRPAHRRQRRRFRQRPQLSRLHFRRP